MKIWPGSWNQNKRKPVMEMRIRVVKGRMGLETRWGRDGKGEN